MLDRLDELQTAIGRARHPLVAFVRRMVAPAILLVCALILVFPDAIGAMLGAAPGKAVWLLALVLAWLALIEGIWLGRVGAAGHLWAMCVISVGVLALSEFVSWRTHQVTPTLASVTLWIAAASTFVAALWVFCFGRTRHLQPKYVRLTLRTLHSAPFIVSVLIMILFGTVAQMREVYLGLIEDTDFVRGAIGLCALMICCILLYCWHTQRSNSTINDIYSEHADIYFDRSLLRMHELLGCLIATLPMLGLGIGLAGLYQKAVTAGERFKAVNAHFVGKLTPLGKSDVVAKDYVQTLDWLPSLPWHIVYCLGMWLAGLAVLLLILRWLSKSEARQRWPYLLGLGIAVVALGGPLLSGDLTIAASRTPGAFTGPSILLISLVTVLMTLRHLFTLARLRVPVAGVVLAGLLTLTAYQIWDDVIEPHRPPSPDLLVESANKDAVGEKLREWLGERKDRSRFSGSKYPVFILAAQGGGIYAASAAATFMAALQDQCPRFAQHVFAISAVSGGAVGSSLFSSLLAADAVAQSADAPCVSAFTPRLADQVESIILRDHLSPVTALLLPDFLRKLMPGFLVPSRSAQYDRADAIERSFSCAFDDARAGRRPQLLGRCDNSVGPTGLRAPFKDHWSPTGAVPALILNTTWAETGYRVAFSPFPLYHVGDRTLLSFNDPAILSLDTTEMAQARSVIQAAVVSARFPGIVPAWPLRYHVLRPKATKLVEQRWNFVDGGYADNSGSATAFELFATLSAYLARFPGLDVDLRLILLTDAEVAPALADIDGTGFSDIVAPVSAILRVRELLARRAVTRAVEQLAPPDLSRGKLHTSPDSKIWIVDLDQRTFPLPLGWMISETANEMVRLMLGHPDLCVEQGPSADNAEEEIREIERAVATVTQNSCVKQHITRLLK